jgi:putative membrane protein
LILGAFLLWQLRGLRAGDGSAIRAARRLAVAGWSVAAIALMSPLCALSVALFSARIGQHMVLVLVAAPLIGFGLPFGESPREWKLWAWTTVFFAALWFWHMPIPYEATFRSDAVYWAMHATLFGSAIFLWRGLIHHPRGDTVQALGAGASTFVHMGLLGAILAMADRPLFAWHLTTTEAWGLTPLQDQQLGGALMWVPGIALFLWIALRSTRRLWGSLEKERAA